MVKNNLLYNQLVDVAEDYLGPAAERFIDRQIESHLQKDPKKITKDDLKKLIQWIRLSIAILTDDEVIIDDFIGKLQELAHSKSQSTKSRHPAKLEV